ncbi:MAG: hypothetical protein JOZ97_01985 [Candidatus Eremiobacteraeota bacterium]|nr:hypothetical protein [Candidatus Eremiobacteraeota bacterium]
MTSEWVAAIASVATFVVIAATAIAALVQLRHMRSSNQIAALSDLRGTLQYEEFWEATARVTSELPRILADPTVQQKIAQRMPLNAIPELAQARRVGNFFDTLGAFVKAKILDEQLACDLWGDWVLRSFEAFKPLIGNARVAYGAPAIWENFELLAVLCQNFDASHPDGTYPKGARRIPLPPLWPDVYQQ